MLAWYRDLIALRRRLNLAGRAQWPRMLETDDIIVLTVPPRPGRDDAELVVAVSLAPADGSGGTDLAALVPDADGLDLALSWLGAPLTGPVLRAGDTLALTRRSRPRP